MATGQDQSPCVSSEAAGDQHPGASQGLGTQAQRIKALFEEYRKSGVPPNEAAVMAMQEVKAADAAREKAAQDAPLAKEGCAAVPAPEPAAADAAEEKAEQDGTGAMEVDAVVPAPEPAADAAAEKKTEEDGTGAMEVDTAASVPEPAAVEPPVNTPAAGSDDAASPSGAARSTSKGSSKADAKESDEPVTAALLLTIANRLESGDDEAKEEAVQLLRKAAHRLNHLEQSVAEFGQVLQAMHHVSGQVLQSFIARDSGAATSPASPQAQGQEAGYPEGTKSYMVKKGDEEVQAAYREHQHQRPDKTQHQSGALSSGAPKTKEEMEAARKARLDMLEAQQAAKKKEQEEGEAKSKAREALFERPLAGAPKQLGKF